jgi:membrane fusion protein, multidrug efflux system
MQRLLFLFLFPIILFSCKQQERQNPIPVPGEAIAVTLAPIQSGGIANSIEATGLLQTEDESKLSFKIGGVVESVYVSEGDYVKAGQVLATLKNTEIASQVNQVQLNVQKAERDYERAYNLFIDSVATLEQLQNAKTGLEIAKQGLSAAQFNQQYARINAPTSGFVVKKLVSAGEIAGPGMPVLILNHVSGSSHWVLKAGVSDAQWASISLGDKAQITFDAFPGKLFEATVTNRSLAADPTNGSFTVELRVKFEKEKPATGMFGKAKIISGKVSYANVIPYAALLEANGNSGFVFVTSDKSTVSRKEVKIGKLYPDRVEIISGLENQSHVVVSGSAFLNEQSTIVVHQ